MRARAAFDSGRRECYFPLQIGKVSSFRLRRASRKIGKVSMHKNLLAVLILALALPGAAAGAPATPSQAPSPAPFTWPDGARAAVSLAYDDALDSQLDIALPALDRHGLKASFYLQLSQPSVATRLAQWRAAALNGHELGNHTLFHQCSASLPERGWVQAHRDLDRISVAQVRDQAIVANTMLLAIDGRSARTFTTPCGDLKAGGQPYLPAITDQFVAIKAGGNDGVVAAMATLDPYAVPVLAPVSMTGAQLIDIVKRAGARGTMVNFTFHGIGGDYLANTSAAHEELLAFLAQHRKQYWTDTFVNIMQHVKQQQRQQPLPVQR
jgi:peptidoglycan/xylan/chitin deacetylase (PgdA/CDA1 family)